MEVEAEVEEEFSRTILFYRERAMVQGVFDRECTCFKKGPRFLPGKFRINCLRLEYPLPIGGGGGGGRRRR